MNEANPIFTYDHDLHVRVCPELSGAFEQVHRATRELSKRWDGPVPRVGDGVLLNFHTAPASERIPLRMDVQSVTWDETGLSPHVALSLALGTTNCPTQQREALVRISDAMKAAAQ